MMAFTSFASGFITALMLLAFLLAVLFLRLRRTRKNQKAVRGYLDLIPDLSPAQREQVQEIRRLFLPRVAEIRENLGAERAELARLLFDEPPDRSKIHSVARQILLHQSDLENEVIEHILEEQELLTPSQKRKFYEIIVEQFSSGGLGVHDVKNRS
jgi:hypothetical protein